MTIAVQNILGKNSPENIPFADDIVKCKVTDSYRGVKECGCGAFLYLTNRDGSRFIPKLAHRSYIKKSQLCAFGP